MPEYCASRMPAEEISLQPMFRNILRVRMEKVPLSRGDHPELLPEGSWPMRYLPASASIVSIGNGAFAMRKLSSFQSMTALE